MSGTPKRALRQPMDSIWSLLEFGRVQKWPRLPPAHLYVTLRVALERYPISIVYRELLQDIQIIAVAHAKRRPGYWANRL